MRVPADDFILKILPLSESLSDLVDPIVSRLKQGGVYNTKKQRWSAFLTDPCNSTQNERRVYAPLATIFEKVVGAAKILNGTLEQTFCLQVEGSLTLASERGSQSQPDSYMRMERQALASLRTEMAQAAGSDGWLNPLDLPADEDSGNATAYNTTIPGQFKKQKNARTTADNVSKIIWDMSKMVCLDPTRRFTFGITIENTELSIWLLSRGDLLRSHSFNFNKNIDFLVRLFLSFGFSSPTEMGWDPSIVCAGVDNEQTRSYYILVGKEVFKTTRTLSNHSAENPLGRAVRVWAVKSSSGGDHVLKDMWLEPDRDEEHIVYERIIDDVEKLQNEEDAKKKNANKPPVKFLAAVKNALFTPIAHSRVMIAGKEDHTTDYILRGYEVENPEFIPIQVDEPPPPESLPIGFSWPGDKDVKLPRRILLSKNLSTKRIHYRIVFKELATTLYNERSLTNIVQAMEEIIFALSALHRAGWVHRDISIANVYYNSNRNAGMLGDLEYARRGGDKRKGHAIRTGTPCFMACEAIVHDHLFTSIPDHQIDDSVEPPRKRRHGLSVSITATSPDPQASATSGTTASISKPHTSAISATTANVPFVYNPLHDLESAWWVLVWIILFYDGGSAPCSDNIASQALIEMLFDGRMDISNRLPFLQNPESKGWLGWLSPSLSGLAKCIQVFGPMLVASYRELESNIESKDNSWFGRKGAAFLTVLRNLELTEDNDILLVPVKATM
ncbi:hypothetical protein GYMLUDRAFT_39259 [Collybiopsis luxurians FD-317 M1]|nr:hypothetical protein GYMLUDRAFT_39259 [Collybiopsis luxurians FD-317 M1]